jgi:hypothetical protein
MSPLTEDVGGADWSHAVHVSDGRVGCHHLAADAPLELGEIAIEAVTPSPRAQSGTDAAHDGSGPGARPGSPLGDSRRSPKPSNDNILAIQ